MRTNHDAPAFPALLLILATAITSFGQGTAFNYQGHLTDKALPANGLYEFNFAVYGAATGGSALTPPIEAATGVTNGLFAATIDFGTGVFTGLPRWLDISVRTNGAANYTTIAPRQPLSPTPYAIFAANAAFASAAGSLSSDLANLVVTGAAKVSTLSVGGGTKFGKQLSVDGSMSVSGDVSIDSTLKVGGGAQFGRVLVDGSISVGGDISVDSTLKVTGDASVRALTIRGGADIAEPFHMSVEEIAKGSVIVIDEEHPGQLKLASQAYDQRVAGIVSGANGIQPGLNLSQQGVLEGGQNVALSGRVYALADASEAPIKPGDLLTSSATPGHCMKVTDFGRAQGAVVGKAMSRLDGGKGMVLVLVSLQ